jgi:hypothetical protein
MSSLARIAIAAIVAAPAVAAAQAKVIPKDDTFKAGTEEDVEGWNPALAGTATINVVSNSGVVGQVDGVSTLLGLGVVGGDDFVEGRHLWRNSVTITETFARTPVVDAIVKTADNAQFESLYNYYLKSNLGLFGRLGLQTALFPSVDVRGEPTTWVDKTMPASVIKANSERLKLAGAFKPFTISESAGAFAEPYKKEKLAISVRAGIGGRHTLADGVLVLDDDKATPEVETVRLSDVHQLGVEVFAGATGKARDGKLTYKAGLAALLPVVNNDSFDRGAAALTRIGFEGSATFNAYEWLSVVYALAITRDPQLFPDGNERTQVQNSVLITLKYAFVEKKKKPKPPTEAEVELAAAKHRAELAEQQAIELAKQLAACRERDCKAP